jgi:hypothetical protein
MSVARTSKVWLPSPSEDKLCGLAHEAQLAPSSRHSKVEPGSLELKLKLGAVLFDGSLGCESIVVSGAVLSTRRLTITLVPVLPAVSVATARTSYRPSETPVVSQLAEKGAEVSVPIVVQVEPPAGARWKTTCSTFVEVSLAVALKPTVAATGVPGSVSDTLGLSVSTFTMVETADVLPTLSVPVSVYL